MGQRTTSDEMLCNLVRQLITDGLYDKWADKYYNLDDEMNYGTMSWDTFFRERIKLLETSVKYWEDKKCLK